MKFVNETTVLGWKILKTRLMCELKIIAWNVLKLGPWLKQSVNQFSVALFKSNDDSRKEIRQLYKHQFSRQREKQALFTPSKLP